jgi:dTMP kinase
MTLGSLGRYIAFEGAEGCGKSTHAARLAADIGAVVTREHGGTRIGTMIRSILADPANTDLTPKAEALLIAADRAQHLAEVVEPAIAAGRHVVSDRSIFSSLAYQAYGRGLPLDTVQSVNEWAIGGRWPELVVFLDVSEAQLSRRMRRRELDRFEREDAEFHARVLDAFRTMAAADPLRWVRLDGDRQPNEVAHDVRAAVSARLGI